MLHLNHVTAGYGDNIVLRDVSLSVPVGSVVALLGANGAGKTSLLRLASGLLDVKSGTVEIDGVEVTNMSPHSLVGHGVCHIPEGRGVFPNLTVRDNLMIQASRGQESEAIKRAVHAFPRLGERLDQIARTMSGGEQQMLALARTYVQAPRYVLLDEVSMGLAPKVVDEIFTFLDLLAAEDVGMLLVEQYVTRALGVADYVYMLNRGEVVFAGEPSELDNADIFAQYVGAAL